MVINAQHARFKFLIAVLKKFQAFSMLRHVREWRMPPSSRPINPNRVCCCTPHYADWIKV